MSASHLFFTFGERRLALDQPRDRSFAWLLRASVLLVCKIAGMEEVWQGQGQGTGERRLESFAPLWPWSASGL